MSENATNEVQLMQPLKGVGPERALRVDATYDDGEHRSHGQAYPWGQIFAGQEATLTDFMGWLEKYNVLRIKLFDVRLYDGREISEGLEETFRADYMVGSLIENMNAELERIRPNICIATELLKYDEARVDDGIKMTPEKVSKLFEGNFMDHKLSDDDLKAALCYHSQKQNLASAFNHHGYRKDAVVLDVRNRYQSLSVTQGVVNLTGNVVLEPRVSRSNHPRHQAA